MDDHDTSEHIRGFKFFFHCINCDFLKSYFCETDQDPLKGGLLAHAIQARRVALPHVSQPPGLGVASPFSACPSKLVHFTDLGHEIRVNQEGGGKNLRITYRIVTLLLSTVTAHVIPM